MKTLGIVLAASTLALSSTGASAWFKVCNAKSNGADMFVTYAYYEPSITTINIDACGSFTRVFSPQYYTAWKNTGWWHITKNQCAMVYTPAINNRWAYVYAQISDGSTLVGANQPNQVSNVAFGIDQYIGGPFGSCSGECIGQTGSGDCGNPAPTYWNVNALPVDQGNYQNFTLTIH
jgi:uncharacterized membrane protein